jgi:hypothetical protein
LKWKLKKDYPRKLDQEDAAAVPMVMSRVEAIEKKVDTPEP